VKFKTTKIAEPLEISGVSHGLICHAFSLGIQIGHTPQTQKAPFVGAFLRLVLMGDQSNTAFRVK
jgi:hypothetical protein